MGTRQGTGKHIGSFAGIETTDGRQCGGSSYSFPDLLYFKG